MTDPGEGDRYVSAAYDELRRIAARYVQRERARTVQATELVHEAWLRLSRNPPAAWHDRAHFVAFAAIAMRRLLVERARRRVAAKRGGPRLQVTLDEALLRDDGSAVIDVLAVDRALDDLARVDGTLARVVELRYFGGLGIDETAAAMGTSPATVKRQWALARAWLVRALDGGAPS